MPDHRRPQFTSRRPARPAASTSWDPLAAWYNGWVGQGGSEYHRKVAIPAVLRLLDLQRGERVLDVGCGQGVLAAGVSEAGAEYAGVDASPRLIELARKLHGNLGRFYLGDAQDLGRVPQVAGQTYDAAVFLLSAQDMNPLEDVVRSAARLVRSGGRIVMLLTHPAFRVPRQSGWGWDENRKLLYRRVDRYLTPLPVPLNPLPGKGRQVVTRSFHRPVSAYVNALANSGFWTDHMEEVPAHRLSVPAATPAAAKLAQQEIPIFLGIRARKVPAGERPG